MTFDFQLDDWRPLESLGFFPVAKTLPFSIWTPLLFGAAFESFSTKLPIILFLFIACWGFTFLFCKNQPIYLLSRMIQRQHPIRETVSRRARLVVLS